MDNGFDILIWLFIILNIISALLKSKKKKGASPSSNEFEKNAEEKGNKTIDFFGMKIPVENEPALDESYGDETDTWDPEEDFREKTDFVQNAVEPSETFAETDREKNQVTKVQKMISEAEKISTEQSENDYADVFEKGESTDERNSRFKKLLGNKDELRRGVIISEILNKPKALRKNG